MTEGSGALCPFCAAEMDIRKRRFCAGCGAERLADPRATFRFMARIFFGYFLLAIGLAAVFRRLLPIFRPDLAPDLVMGLSWIFGPGLVLILTSKPFAPLRLRILQPPPILWRKGGETRPEGALEEELQQAEAPPEKRSRARGRRLTPPLAKRLRSLGVRRRPTPAQDPED